MRFATATGEALRKVSSSAIACQPESGIPGAPAIGCRPKRSGTGPPERSRPTKKPGLHLGVSNTKSTEVLKQAMQNGTSPVRTSKANKLGIFDLRGNVWEWCGDYFDVVISPDAVRNPTGPAKGLERVIRGGSFVSTMSGWSRDYRSSIRPGGSQRLYGFSGCA